MQSVFSVSCASEEYPRLGNGLACSTLLRGSTLSLFKIMSLSFNQLYFAMLLSFLLL